MVRIVNALAHSLYGFKCTHIIIQWLIYIMLIFYTDFGFSIDQEIFKSLSEFETQIS